MRTTCSVVFLLLLLPGGRAVAGDGIHRRTLGNGLKVVVKEDHKLPLAALRIYVRTGGAFEMEFLGCGISHYYEHLLSGGTTSNRTEEESAKILMELGGQSNAYTRSTHTCYHIVTHRDLIGRAVEMYADWMMNNTLDPGEVEREKGVILKEINMGEDEPGRVLYKLFVETMFREHPIRVPNIGYRQNFERITREDLSRYYRNHYAPNNTVVAVAGDVDPEEVFALVEKHMGKWERRPVPVVILKPEPRQTAPRYAEKEMDVRQAWVRMGYHTIDLFHEDLYALDMVAAVLSQGRTSRLFRRVVEEERLVRGIECYSYTPWFMTGTFGIRFQAPVEKTDRAIEVVKEEIARVKGGPVTEEELSRAKVLLVSEYQLKRQSVQDQAAQVGIDLLTTDDPRFSVRYTERIQAVTPEQVVAAARKYLLDRTLSVAALKPIGTGRRDTAARTEGGGPGGLTEARLENGVRIAVRRIPGVSPVAVEAYVHGGVRAEPEGKNGVSYLTGRLLLKGTANRSAEQIAREMESIGGSISSQSGNNTVGVSITLARGARDLPLAAEVLGDVLGGATFPREEFEKERTLAVEAARSQDEKWQGEAIRFMRRELYGSHPYGRSSLATPESVAALSRDDVRGFAERWIRPEGLVVAVAGDVDPEEVIGLLRTRLGGLSGTGDYAPPSPGPPAWAASGLSADRSAFLENQKRQGVLCLAFPGPPYRDIDDRAALSIVDAFTSGIGLPSGWFHTALRGGERSLVYFVHLGIFSGLEPGAIYVYTQAEAGLLKEVYGLLVEQLDRLRAGGFTDEELEIGRTMALVARPYYAQTVNDVATGLALGILYGGGADSQEKFQAALKSVTREDVMRVVTRYMKHMLVVGTGPKEIRPIFKTLR